MTNKEMLENIEYLREHADVSYEESERLLEQYDGNVMRVLVELERQGRVYDQASSEGQSASRPQREQNENAFDEGVKKAKGFVDRAMRTHLVVEKKTDGGKTKVVDIPAPLAILGAVAAPWLTVVAAGAGFVTGHTAKIKKVHETKED